MARDDEDPSEDELDLDGEEEAPEPVRTSPRPRPARRSPSAPMRPWDAPEDDAPTEEWETGPSARRRLSWDRKPVYWRARDSLYFEPLVALAIVVLLLVGLYAFTQNWPPAYVVESVSMQHGAEDQVGLINAGDLVLAEKVPTSSIVPYVVGYQTGVHTYGEDGDVVLYHPNGNDRGTPIVHRAIMYLEWDAAKHSYNATDLNGVTCARSTPPSNGKLYYSTNSSGCGTIDLSGALELYNVGWDSKLISMNLNSPALGDHSGFLTMGDGNPYPDQYSTGGSSPVLSSLVEPGWVIGVARGMLPWFGAIKLLIEGNARNVSSVSWQFLGLSIVVAILGAFGIHYALRQEGIESPMRRREEEEAASYSDEDRPHRFLGALRGWKDGADDEEEDERPPPRPRRRPPAPPPRPREPTEEGRGRPRPHVHRPPRRRRDDDET